MLVGVGDWQYRQHAPCQSPILDASMCEAVPRPTQAPIACAKRTGLCPRHHIHGDCLFGIVRDLLLREAIGLRLRETGCRGFLPALQLPVTDPELHRPQPWLSRIPVIAGPTAGGKSALAYALVQALREPCDAGRPGIECEIVSADAFQIYTGLDIATAKATEAERAFVRHHLIDVVDPRGARSASEGSSGLACSSAFTVADWLARAEAVIADIRARGRLPIVVGGTHLYIKALLEGLFEGPNPDPALRASLQARPLASLRAELERVDSAAAVRIHPNDSRRTVRALEVYHQTGTPISTLQRQWDAGRTRHDCLLIALDWPVDALNRRINARVTDMMDRGMLAETRGLLEAGAFGTPGIQSAVQRQAAEALGTKQLLEHLRGACTLEEAVERIKIETRRFAKNQRTWLKRLQTTSGAVVLRADEILSSADQTADWAREVLDQLSQPNG